MTEPKRPLMQWRFATILLASLASCHSLGGEVAGDRVRSAERFFRGIYSGDPSVVDELASPDIVVTYPIFATLFGTPVLRGKEAVKEFSIRFAKKWVEPEIVLDEVISEGRRVVLVWSFQARDRGDGNTETATAPVKRWGGITVFHFDGTGRIAAEFGEESQPGPFGRLRSDVQ